MSASTKTGQRTGFDASHVRFYKPHMQCPAFHLLPSPAVHLLVILYGLHDGTNNGEIRCGVRTAADLMNRSPNGTYKYFWVLQDMGWIRPSRPGSFSLKDRVETEWILTEFQVGENPPTKEFLQWNPARKKGGKKKRDETDGEKSTVAESATDGSGICDHGSGMCDRDGSGIESREC